MGPTGQAADHPRRGLGRYAGFHPDANTQAATLTTVPITPTDKPTLPPLAVNAPVHTGGNVTAALVDAETLTPLAGRAAEDCRPMATDAASPAPSDGKTVPTPPCPTDLFASGST